MFFSTLLANDVSMLGAIKAMALPATASNSLILCS